MSSKRVTKAKPKPSESNDRSSKEIKESMALQSIAGPVCNRAKIRLSNDSNQTKSLLLSLPRELRDIIYDLVLDYDGVQRGINKLNRQFPDAKTALRYHSSVPELLITPGILLTCRQVYEEALEVLSKLTLIITSPLSSMDFEGLGLQLNNVMSSGSLERIHHVRFEMCIWNPEVCNIAVLETWVVDDFISKICDSDAWAVLFIACLNIWINENNLKSLDIVVHPPGKGDDVFNYPGIRDFQGVKKRVLPSMDKVSKVKVE
jgi:hypothetical protein